jgi:hypothetical protein
MKFCSLLQHSIVGQECWEFTSQFSFTFLWETFYLVQEFVECFQSYVLLYFSRMHFHTFSLYI